MEKYSNNNDKIRDKYVLHLNKVVGDEGLSRKIEKSVYNYIIKFSKEKNIQRDWSNKLFYKLYSSKIMSIYVNLNCDSYIQNKEFLIKIISNEIDTKDIGELSVYDIYPENWKKMIDDKTKRDKLKYELKAFPFIITSLIKKT